MHRTIRAFHFRSKANMNTVPTFHLTLMVSVGKLVSGHCFTLTRILLMWTIWRVPTNASKWRMGFNSAFKGLVDTASVILLAHVNKTSVTTRDAFVI